MSRVDEAMKRAAGLTETNPGEVSSVPTLEPMTAEDADALAREPFPIEIAEHRRIRHVEVASSAIAPVAPADIAPTTPSSLLERIDAGLAQKVVIDREMQPMSREQYRRLAAALYNAQATTGLKVILVASAVAGEGKTLTAANLALTFSESYLRPTLLVDADLRKPSLQTVFHLEGASGLAEGLTSREERRVPVRQVSQYLSVLTAGRPSSDPMAGLTSSRMQRLITEARDAFDWVIVDTPPVGLLPDANLLAAMADGAVLVVKADSTPYPMVQRAVATLGIGRVLGVVLNRATTPAHASRYGYGYDYYGVRSNGKRA
jgi:capsular exopolysaccharide synthesis family protein